MRLLLASTSKFKSDIFNKVHLKHTNIKTSYVEEEKRNENVYEYVMDLALGKAKNTIKLDDSIVIGLDTVVYIDNEIIEKPKNKEEVRFNLRRASGKEISVITGICLINNQNGEIIRDYQETKISFNEIVEDDIEYYLANEPELMYVSGFVIETIISNFINKIEGSFYNILGAPVEKIYFYLKKWGIHLKDLI